MLRIKIILLLALIGTYVYLAPRLSLTHNIVFVIGIGLITIGLIHYELSKVKEPQPPKQED